MHPEKYEAEVCEPLTWARLEGTRGNLFHIFEGRSPSGSLRSYCGRSLSPHALRSVPLVENAPSAKACPHCLSRHRR